MRCASAATDPPTILGLVCLLLLGLAGLPAFTQHAAAQTLPGPEAAPTAEEQEAESPHPFFTHMGLPEGVGNFNLRTAGLVLRTKDETEGGSPSISRPGWLERSDSASGTTGSGTFRARRRCFSSPPS